ncbi:cytochrome P450 4d2 [Amyelois transitella]|uniref:cytochrome P450 4d2 n=1 Tax=Amyelois transitella TaxID=680683 RepID=UPI00298F40A8|nr:cytochrome P450 4d2 [Amyelois transitella]
MRSFEQVGRDALANDGIVSIWLVNKLIVVLADPNDIEVVMKECLDKDKINDVAKDLVGSGSIIAPALIWRPRRKILAPTFAPKTLNGYVQIFVKQSDIFLDILSNSEGNGDLSIFDKATRYSMDSICETTLDTDIKCQSQPDHPVLESFATFCKLVVLRAARPWYHSDQIYKWCSDYPHFQNSIAVLKQFIKEIIASKREQLTKIDKKVIKVQSLLDLLMSSDDGKGFSDLELQEETLVVVLAGTDTSAAGASFAALLMAKHSDVQEKVYRELMDVLGNRPVQAEDLPKLKYLEAVLKETLRLYPPVPLLFKKSQNNLKLSSEVTLPSDLTIAVNIWALHRNIKYWGDDAEIFRPERFFGNTPTHQYAYVPFGKGPRMCLGANYAMLSMKTVLASLVRRFRLLPPTAGFEAGELPTKFEIMLKHVGNFELQLARRIKD